MEIHVAFLALGGILFAGMLADVVGRRTRLPRVSLMILCGVAAGPAGFDLLPHGLQDWYEFLASVALSMVAFLLGGQLSLDALRGQGRVILTVSAAAVIITAVVVGIGLAALGASLVMALLLAGISTATDPAATQDVIKQSRAKGTFTTTLVGIVAIDDAWGLILFSLLLLTAKAIVGDGGIEILQHSLWEIGGAVAVGTAGGAAVGLPDRPPARRRADPGGGARRRLPLRRPGPSGSRSRSSWPA